MHTQKHTCLRPPRRPIIQLASQSKRTSKLSIPDLPQLVPNLPICLSSKALSNCKTKARHFSIFNSFLSLRTPYLEPEAVQLSCWSQGGASVVFVEVKRIRFRIPVRLTSNCLVLQGRRTSSWMPIRSSSQQVSSSISGSSGSSAHVSTTSCCVLCHWRFPTFCLARFCTSLDGGSLAFGWSAVECRAHCSRSK